MQYIRTLLVFLFLACCAETVLGDAGLIAEWNFDEAEGDVARDSSGNGHDATLNGATWDTSDGVTALRFNGVSSAVECTESAALNLAGSLTLEAWVKPLAVGWGECHLIGKSSSEYMLNYSNRGMSWWLVASGNYNIGGKLDLGQWNHLVATFDGKQRHLWINGQLVMSAEATPPAGQSGPFTMGALSGASFNGLLDGVRVYNRALAADEAVARYKKDAAVHGVNIDRFERVQITPYYYLNDGRIALELNYRGLQPLSDGSRIELAIVNASDPTKPIDSRTIDKLPSSGITQTELAFENLADGKYQIAIKLVDVRGERASEPITFEYPQKAIVPSPSESIAGRVQAPAASAPFEIQPTPGGGIAMTINGITYPFDSRISWPNGEFNTLSATSAAAGEPGWKVETRTVDKNHHEILASGAYYSIRRQIEVLPTHVTVKDTYTNTTDTDLGLLIYNELPLKNDRPLRETRLAGYEGGGRMVDGMYPHYGGASVFVQDDNAGIGMLPLDDVYVLQSVIYIDKDAAGMGTETFALAPKAFHTLEWAIYPHGRDTAASESAPGGYYDFINAFRKAENRIGTVEGGASFISFGPMNRRQVPSDDFVNHRGIQIGIISCLSGTADDPGLSLEGIEFIDFPKEMELLKQQAKAIHARHPSMKVVFHNAHTLYCTKDPERYADSKLILSHGVHAASGGPGAYFSQERIDDGWRWYVYYPTPGNSFHDAMMKSVDIMMDDMGMDGVFVDGFLMGYGGRWTYDRWDGHSAEIDPKTKTITRKKASVLLLMQPSMIEYSRKIRDKGGVVIANGSVMTRSIANEKYIIFDAECQAGPECHLAPSAMSLSNPPFHTEKELYMDVLDKLRWGVLYMYYNERINLTYPSLPAKCFPITFEEIRPGLVRGKERIITMNSGVYGWPKDDSLHIVHPFDGRGAPVGNRFVTTIDEDGVRSDLRFAENESAVIERIPATIQSDSPVNAMVFSYDGQTLQLAINGNGKASLNFFVGTSYPDRRDGKLTDGGTNPGAAGVGDAYDVSVGGTSTQIEERDGMLTVPLELNGQVTIEIRPAEAR